MPRPPILEPVDFRAAWEGGKSWIDWLSSAESEENAEKMRSSTTVATLSEPVRAYLSALPRPVHVLAFAEDWCGDVQRYVPVLERLAAHAPNLLIRYVSREDQPELFKRFLTNGGESVPKFVFFNEDFVECGNWGPLPAAMRLLLARGKAAGDVATARKQIATLSDADGKSQQATRELLELIDIASTVAL
jgi:thiol-disulfide isomerase/thioredoxin